jgi:energy-coupling factor transporter ATP-binding protein EcfA2
MVLAFLLILLFVAISFYPSGILPSITPQGYLALAAAIGAVLAFSFVSLLWQFRKVEQLLYEQSAEREFTKQEGLYPDQDIARPGQGEIPSVPDDLVAACVSGDCILFAGGGLSCQAGLPAWREGLIRIIETIRADSNATDAGLRWEPLESLLKSGGELAYAADLISSRLPREQLIPIVRKMYGTAPALPEVFSVLRQTPFAGIVTVVWDQLLESAYRDKELALLSPKDSERLAPLLRDKGFFLLKIYGDLEQPDSFLFTPQDYRQAVAQNEAFSKFLASLYLERTLFFVGMSLDGIEEFLTPLKIQPPQSRSHFALVPRTRNMEIHEERFRAKYGIRLLSFTATPGFPEVVNFLKDLQKKVRVASPSGTPRKSEPIILEQVTLKDIGPFQDLSLKLDKKWNVLLGNNGCGKSTLLRAIALGLCGDEREARELGKGLLRAGEQNGSIELKIGNDTFRTELERSSGNVLIRSRQLTPLQTGRWVVLGFAALRGASSRKLTGPTRDGWANPMVEDVLPLLASPVDYRLDDLKQWVVNIHARATGTAGDPQNTKRSAELRDSLFRLLADLTPGVECSFDRVDESWQVLVKTADGVVTIDQLSQGTTSVFSWVGTLLQRLYDIYKSADNPKDGAALVLIDEISTHMHPEWQQELVPALQKHFPGLQIIATTHSPLIVAGLEKEQVKVLNRDAETGQVQVDQPARDLIGLRADQILTELFGLLTTRSKAAMKRYNELLQMKDRKEEEQKEFERLRGLLRENLKANETPAPKAEQTVSPGQVGDAGRALEPASQVKEELRRQLEELFRGI